MRRYVIDLPFVTGALLCLSLAGCQSERTVAAPLGPSAVAVTASDLARTATGGPLAIGMGESVQLEPSLAVKRGRQLRWSSSNPGVARVDSRGLVTGIALGEATITDASATATERRVVTVGPSVASITVQPESATLVIGGSVQLVVTLWAANGSVISGRVSSFTSLASAVARVSSNGLVSGVAAGSTSVQVTQGSAVRAVPVRVGTAAPPPTPPPTTPPPPTPPPPPPTGGALGLNADLAPGVLFPVNNPWNQPVDTAQVDPNSTAIINNIGATKPFHPDFGADWNGGPFGIPYIVVSGAQARVNVTFDYWDESDPGPYPIPANAPIEGGAASGGDRHVIIVDRDNWKLYELFAAYPQPNGSWQAGSGAVFDLNSNALRPAGWTSADAAGLPILPGLVRYDEVTAGVINHAIRFTVSRTRKAYIPPARHWASSDTSSLRPPMGMRVRLKAGFNISSYPPSAQVILRALKKYGMIVADNGSDWYVSGTADARWNDTANNTLKALRGSDFEVVKMSGVVTP